MNKIVPGVQTFAVPLDKLDLSDTNVRRTHPDAEIEALAASIEAMGLLQNLGVMPALDAGGEPNGRYEVIAGGRRLRALRLLAKRKKLAKAAPIDCKLVPRESGAEASLAENCQQVTMHPADAFEAFSGLHAEGKGQSVERIAARFGVSAHTVKQRLRLAAVSPRLLAEFRAGRLTLEQVMAYTVSDDHAAQERVYDTLPSWANQPHAIRAKLTEGDVPAHDRRAVFVGAEDYEAAGGTVRRDLFSTAADGGWFTDAALLDKLVVERLDREAETVRAEGWGWVQVAPCLPPDFWSHRRIAPKHAPLTEEQEERLSELGRRYDALAEEAGGDPTEGQEAELDAIQEEIDAIEAQERRYDPDEVARSGAWIVLGHEGVRIERGVMRPGEDLPGRPGATIQVPGNEAGQDADPDAVDAPNGKPAVLSAALRSELLAHRTAALQAEVAARPDLAVRVLLHSLLLERVSGPWGSVAKLSLHGPALNAACPGIGETPARKRLAELTAVEVTNPLRLPERDGLLAWVLAMDTPEVLKLLAVLVAHGIDAGDDDWTTPKGAASNAARVARAAGLDMARWWTPTPDTYLARVPKGLILAAVREGADAAAAAGIEGMKKRPMAEAAGRALDGKGWVPTLLRVPGTARDTGAEAAPEAQG